MKAHLISLIVFFALIGTACARAVPSQPPQVHVPTAIPTQVPPTA